MAWVVGLTGGIASGKSTVGRLFESLGAQVIDTDQVARELTEAGGAALPALAAEFGPALLTPAGALDRSAMRRLAFSDPGARRRLEALLHPMIRDRVQSAVAASRAPYVVLMVPLLFESGGILPLVDTVVTVDCPEEAQLSRAMARSGLSRDEARAIMAAQMPRSARLERSDHVIDNGGDEAALAAQVAGLHRIFLALAAP